MVDHTTRIKARWSRSITASHRRVLWASGLTNWQLRWKFIPANPSLWRSESVIKEKISNDGLDNRSWGYSLQGLFSKGFAILRRLVRDSIVIAWSILQQILFACTRKCLFTSHSPLVRPSSSQPLPSTFLIHQYQQKQRRYSSSSTTMPDSSEATDPSEVVLDNPDTSYDSDDLKQD